MPSKSLLSGPAKYETTEILRFNENREGRLSELDGWRALSVLLVILHHVGGYQHHRFVSEHPFLDLRFHYFGPLGVKIFFVISGFVICRLLISEELRYGSVSLQSFYYRRIFRILPPLYIYLTTVSLLLFVGLIRESWTAILYSVLFLRDIHLGPLSWFVGHTWSLAVEEQFYLIFPTMWVLAPTTWKRWLFLSIFFLCAAWNLSMVYTGWDALISADIRAGFACISFGVLMAIHEGRLRSVVNRLPGFILAAAALTLLVHPVDSKSWQGALYESLVVPPAIGAMLFYSLERGAWLRDFLCCKPVQALGLASYGIYLWQQLFTAPKIYFAASGQIIPLLLPLLAVIVPLSYFFIEKPAMRYGKFLSRNVLARSMGIKTPAEEYSSS